MVEKLHGVAFKKDNVMVLMNRRDLFLATAAAFGTLREGLAETDPNDRINTVLGPVRPAGLGCVLMHEHVLVDLVGADRIAPGRYDGGEVRAVVLPLLKQLYSQGCRTFVDCTPTYQGRDPALLARLSRASGLHILTNTGFYGAAGGRYIPKSLLSATVEEVAAIWSGECRTGIPPTGVLPAIIKGICLPA